MHDDEGDCALDDALVVFGGSVAFVAEEDRDLGEGYYGVVEDLDDNIPLGIAVSRGLYEWGTGRTYFCAEYLL